MIPVHLVVPLGELAHDIADVSVNGLVGLRSVWLWHIDRHVSLLEKYSVAKHLCGQVFIEIGVGSFGIPGILDVIRDVSRTVRLGEEVIFFLTRLLISSLVVAVEHCGQGIHSPELLGRRLRSYSFVIDLLFHFVEPFLDVKEVIHLVGELASLGRIGVINILQVRANRDLVLFIVLVDHQLVSAHGRE